MTPAVYIVGADKGGVGKTTVAKVLMDYLTAKGIKPRAIDTESPPGNLKRFWPSAELIDMTSDAGQMQTLDKLAGVTVIDVKAGLLSVFLEAMRDMGFFTDYVETELVTMKVLHVLGPTIASRQEIAAIEGLAKHADYLMVKNHINNYEWEPPTGSKLITVPFLTNTAVGMMDDSAQSYGAFMGDTEKSLSMRGKTRHWYDQVIAEFERVRLAPQAQDFR